MNRTLAGSQSGGWIHPPGSPRRQPGGQQRNDDHAQACTQHRGNLPRWRVGNQPAKKPFYEMAHQWWGNMLIPAETEGAALLTETLTW